MIYAPYCNYTELGNMEFKYASGAYSIAYRTGNGLGSDREFKFEVQL